jgi:hypothetical protein
MAVSQAPRGVAATALRLRKLPCAPIMEGNEREVTYMAKGKNLHKGDKVSWKSHGGEAVGEVEKKITDREEAAGRTVDASPDEPQYQVRSKKSGRSAAHKREALRKEK